MSIDYQAGVRHAAQLLEHGGEVDLILATLDERPPQFAAGMRAVLTDPVILTELLKHRAGEGIKYASETNLPNTQIVQSKTGQWLAFVRIGDKMEPLGTFETKEEANQARAPFLSRGSMRKVLANPSRPYPGLEHCKENRWRVRRRVNGKCYVSKLLPTYDEAIAAWKIIDDQVRKDIGEFA